MGARPPGAAIKQRGAAVLLLLALLGIVLPVMLAASHRLPRPEEASRQRSLAALRTAREALIARAVKGRRDMFAPGNEPDYRPGSLPCPDVDDDGSADGSHCFGYLGRLPYKTLEIDDLRDGAGERLWYALSPNFRPAYYPLRDTRAQLQLQLDGEQYAALLLAPGQVIGTQSRRCDDPASRRGCPRLDPANYLEGRNALDIDPATAARAAVLFEARAESGRADPAFNDLVLPLSAELFMPAVARRVAAEAARCLIESDHALRSRADIVQAFPAAGVWLPGNSPCGGAQPNGYFDAWRPHIHYLRREDGALQVEVFDARGCRKQRGQSC